MQFVVGQIAGSQLAEVMEEALFVQEIVRASREVEIDRRRMARTRDKLAESSIELAQARAGYARHWLGKGGDARVSRS